MAKKKSAILEAVHETATGLHKAGLIDQTTLREFECLYLSKIEPLEPKQIKEIRESLPKARQIRKIIQQKQLKRTG
ncbi:hypothetical protein [Nostoc sp. UHCC 0252]|uniref:hypothetical protein n=1 Tax=Nostoc sp. UHCC 0252 TaxID=3110241 RepID=UPI002B20014A|nr:hypothetical protein [Nostoc sp. UHCC 0252]MEA5605143.1 hypothetical protein [Nostoc sp. UHCC 0252]